MDAFPPINPRAPFIWHGGDYNPEQWPPAVWDEDMALMQASSFRVATVGVFSWATLQPEEDRFEFGWLDDVIAKLHGAGRLLVLATPTAAQPAWMSRRYPDVLRADAYGRRVHHGGRTNFCPSSPTYRRFAVAIATRLAERYGNHPALMLWHVANEYATPCYCEICAAGFREWLRRRYGTLDELNARWYTRFWSHTYGDWDEVEPPYANGEYVTHGLTIDYRRFQSDAMLECFTLERDAIRPRSPGVPITTNFMGAYPHLDYRSWAKELDVVAWDCYPKPSDRPADIAFLHDLNRGLKDGRPFLLLEQTPSSQNWQPVNALKRPGVLRLWSYLAIAHGADSAMYFQWRRSRGGGEKFHGAVVEHSDRADTRVFREVSELGAELERLGDTMIGARTPARVAVVFDWGSWWALEAAIGPINPKEYVGAVRKHYGALWRRNVPVDIVFADSDLAGYDLVVAPMLHMLRPGFAERVEALLERGGSFVATYLSGVVDESDLVFEGGWPGPLRRLLGLWVEEIDALYEGQGNRVVMAGGGESYTCGRLCDIVRLEGAEAIAVYGEDFYAGMPALTVNRLGAGRAYYLATDPEERMLDDFYGGLLAAHGIEAALATPAEVEVAVREKDGRRLLFLLNHGAQAAQVALPEGQRYRDHLAEGERSGALELPPHGVALLEAIG
jgi:beta-galactosidase